MQHHQLRFRMRQGQRERDAARVFGRHLVHGTRRERRKVEGPEYRFDRCRLTAQSQRAVDGGADGRTRRQRFVGQKRFGFQESLQ